MSTKVRVSNGKTRRKRNQPCTNCRQSKLKCVYSEIDGNRSVCNRCKENKLLCRLETDQQPEIDALHKRVETLERTLEVVLRQLEEIRSGDAFSVSDSNSSYQETHSYGGGRSNSGVGLHNHRHKRPRTASELLSDLTASKLYDHISGGVAGAGGVADVVDRGVISFPAAQECVEYFGSRLARYLPVLVFEHLPDCSAAMIRRRSPLLFTAVLAVVSLYNETYRNLHEVFRKELGILLENKRQEYPLSFARTAEAPLQPNEQSNHNAAPVSRTSDETHMVNYDLLGLVIAGAWLGNELGFMVSQLATDVIGWVLASPDAPSICTSLFENITLVAYIVEKRLRLIHDQPAAVDLKREHYVRSLLSRHAKSRLNPGNLKALANVELCALITTYQRELNNNEKIDLAVLSHWNKQLGKWLNEWTGKLTVHLRPSSLKPLLLTFHYAKLFLNLRLLQEAEDSSHSKNGQPANAAGHIEDDESGQFIVIAEQAATDILDMLVFDSDIQRLIKVGPVFYPTIFVTAAALLLKLVCLDRANIKRLSLNNESMVLELVSMAYSKLEQPFLSSPLSEVLPCHETVANLGRALRRVTEAGNMVEGDGTSFDASPHVSRPMARTLMMDSVQGGANAEATTSVDHNHGIGIANVSTEAEAQSYQWTFTPVNDIQTDAFFHDFDGVFRMDAHSSNILQSLLDDYKMD